MNNAENAIGLTVVYADAAAGRLTASIPSLPGTISTGRTQAEARRNVIDALLTMLSVEPEDVPTGATTERVSVTLTLGRGRARGLGLDR